VSGPFSTRDDALRWLREHGLEHLQQISAAVLAPGLERYRLLDLASDESIARQYTPHRLSQLGLPQRAWQFFQAEHLAIEDAQRELAQRLAAPADPRAAELHRRLVKLRQTFSPRMPPQPDRALDPGRLVLATELPGFTLADSRRWEIPGHFGFIDPVSTVRVDPAAASCTCQQPRCIHALAALDTVLRWLHQAGHDAELAQLCAAPWGRALDALSRVIGEAAQPLAALTWRLDVRDDFELELTPWVQGRPRSPSKLLALLDQPLDAADAALAAHLEAGDHAAMLAALVDHPRVVISSNPNRRLTIVRTEIALVAEDRDGTVVLSLGVDGTPLPEPLLDRVRKGQHQRPLFLWDPGTCRLEHLVLRPQVREAFAVLTRFGNVFPPEATQPLLAQLAAAASRMPVVMPRSLLGESTVAELRFVVRLELLTTGGVRFELRVRPLPESDAFYPGEGPRDVAVRRGLKALHAVRSLRDEVAGAEQLEARLPLRDAQATPDRFAYELPSAAEALELIHALRTLDAPPALEWVGEPVRLTGRGGARELRVTVERRTRDFWGVLGDLSIEGERVKLAVALDAARRRRRFVRVSERSYVELTELLRMQLEQLAAHVQPTRSGLTLAATAADSLNALRQAGAKLELDDDFLALVERLKAARAIDVTVPETLKASLRDYQREGFEWLVRLAAWGAGGVLADDMGLGKTVQALALLLHRAPLGPALVIAPTSVVFNWVQEAERFAPSLKLHLRHPKRRLGPRDVVVTSYGLLPRQEQHFSTLVLDEAHALKNAATQRARNVRTLRADFVVGLTGTPVENHLGELWSLYRVVMPTLLGSWEGFRDRFAIPIEKKIDPDAPARLSRVLDPFLLRRTKAQVLRELPPRTEVRVPVTLSAAEWQLYEDARLAILSDLETSTAALKDQGRRIEVLAALTRLRLLASHPRLYDPASQLTSSKLSRLIELVHTLRAEGHRALVFSQFTAHLAWPGRPSTPPRCATSTSTAACRLPSGSDRYERFKTATTRCFSSRSRPVGWA
jgi:hypothetical protein